MKLPLMSLGSRPLKQQKPLIKGTDVRHLQQALKRLGFLKSGIDGVFGHKTLQAVKEFQKTLNLKSRVFYF